MSEQFFFKCNLNFNLRNPKSNQPTLIYAVISYSSKQYRISIGRKVYPKHWDYKRQVCIIGSGLSHLDNYNNRSANDKIKEVILAFMELKSYICKSDNIENINFHSILNSMIEPNRRKRNNTHSEQPTITMYKYINSIEIADGTRKQYNKMIKNFEDWLNTQKISNKWDNINRTNIELFKEYLINNHFAFTTINLTISILKKILRDIDTLDNWSYSSSQIEKIQKVKEKLSKSESNELQIALSWEDLKELYNFSSLSERQTEIKDLFILQSYCGQRISDIPKLFECDLSKCEDTIIINQQKTKEKAYIPINQTIREILIKYKNGFKFIDLNDENVRRRINRDIKEICKKIERFNRISSYKKQKGREIITIDEPIYKRIHTHTARHSFITNWLRDGKDKDSLILITGHSDSTMIDRVYQHLNDYDKANIVSKANNYHKDSNDNNLSVILEAKSVLHYLGADTDEYIDINDLDKLHRLLYGKYESKLLNLGLDYQIIKELYNTKDMNIREKKEALNNLIKEFKNKK